MKRHSFITILILIIILIVCCGGYASAAERLEYSGNSMPITINDDLVIFWVDNWDTYPIVQASVCLVYYGGSYANQYIFQDDFKDHVNTVLQVGQDMMQVVVRVDAVGRMDDGRQYVGTWTDKAGYSFHYLQ